MGFTCRFLHNQVYSAQDVNQAFSRLTSQGVSLFSDTGNPLTDLNTAVSNLVTDGIELDYDACKVVSTGGGSYKVMPGTAIMPNGEMITVDTGVYIYCRDWYSLGCSYGGRGQPGDHPGPDRRRAGKRNINRPNLRCRCCDRPADIRDN